ncbi:hypothetical protein INE76_02659 [Bacteroides xylanisolvens CL03T12C04]|nr:hypothetical protein [Bacteroides xylanisolvens CL03T12C04]
MDVIADTVPAFITERNASGKADLEMSVAYLFDVCRLNTSHRFRQVYSMMSPAAGPIFFSRSCRIIAMRRFTWSCHFGLPDTRGNGNRFEALQAFPLYKGQ